MVGSSTGAGLSGSGLPSGFPAAYAARGRTAIPRWPWPGRLPMPISDIHLDIARIALKASCKYGFALAGGNAMMAHGLVDRYTADVDLFTDCEGGVEAAATGVEKALRAAGYLAERQDKTAGLADIFEGMGDGLGEWIVTAPSGEQTLLQMSFFARSRPVVMMDVGPVLDVEDVVGGKAAALAGRAETRDYIDIAAVSARWTPGDLMDLAWRLDPGLHEQDFRDAVRMLDQVPDVEFAQLGLSPPEIAALRMRFVLWPR